jgi:hypothetical protein
MDFGGTLLTVYATSLVVVLLFLWSATRAARRDDEARGMREPVAIDAAGRELVPAHRPAPFPRGERRSRGRFAR